MTTFGNPFLVTEKKFKKSTNYFLKNYDGKAVTCEEFLNCIQKFSKTDVGKFSKWYVWFIP